MYSILAISLFIFDLVLSLETRETSELNKREKIEFSPVIPSDVKGG
jgi:hypothetical protein